jgi:hypothetical protein
MKKQFNLLILLALIPFFAFSNDGDFSNTKQKNIKKAYIVNPDAILNIDNSYGNITVTTWNEDKIELDITIKVSGNNENWVNQRIDDIDIDLLPLKNMITAKTVIGNSNNKSRGSNNCFEINYIVKIPKNGSIKLSNKYGNIVTGDLGSSVDITCKYGKLLLGKLNGNRNAIQMEYSTNSSIDYLKNGTITAKYSGLKIDSLTKLDLVSDYTNVVIQEADNIRYISKYGNIKIQKVNSLDATGSYLPLQIGELFNQLKLNTKYSNVTIGSINANATDVVIVAAYTNVKIGYQPNYAFDFDVKVRYGNLESDSDLEFDTNKESSSSRIYRGFNRKKGTNTLSITSDYGNVSLSKKK